MDYLLLFTSALLAATLIPAQSEAVLVGLLLNGQSAFWLLIAVATLGNTLGSVINWWLGRYLEHFQDKRWFPVKAANLVRAQQWFQRYGWGVLLLSWLPVIAVSRNFHAGKVLMATLPSSHSASSSIVTITPCRTPQNRQAATNPATSRARVAGSPIS